MNKTKRIALFLVAIMLMLTFVACQAGPENKAEQKILEITDEEKAEGYLLFTELGVKFKQPESFKKYPNNIQAYDAGDSVDEENPLYAEIIYEFIPNEVMLRFQELMMDENMEDQEKFDAVATEVWEKTKPLYAFTLVRVDKEPESPEALSELTKFPINDEIGRGDKYIQYLSMSENDPSELSEEAKAAYDEIMADVQKMKSTITAGRPVGPAEGILNTINLQFSSEDIDGNPVDQSFFKDQKLTMVNVWATWCGPCRSEIPEIAQIETAYGGDVKVLGIVTDLSLENYDEKVLSDANNILETSGANYLNIKASPDLESSILKFVSAVPTTFFVDSYGDVVGDLIIGPRDLDGFKAEIDKILQ